MSINAKRASCNKEVSFGGVKIAKLAKEARDYAPLVGFSYPHSSTPETEDSERTDCRVAQGYTFG